MNLRDLRYLVALDDHRHFGRAAEASFVSQPTLSTQLKKLEDELGVQLIERGTPIETVRMISGHKTLSMVLRYTHVSNELVDQAIESVQIGASR